jgi:hypothetical protein
VCISWLSHIPKLTRYPFCLNNVWNPNDSTNT